MRGKSGFTSSSPGGARAHVVRAHVVRVTIVGVAIVGLLLSATACGSSKDNAGEGSGGPATTVPPSDPVPGGAVTVGLVGSPDGFSPANSRYNQATYMIAKAIYDPLVVVGDDGLPHPYLAESLTPNDSFTAWKVKARPNITFHNGEPLDATALKLNLEALPKGIISGLAAGEIESVDIVDPLTVQLNLSAPDAHLPVSFTGQPGFILAPEQIRSQDPDVIIGTGPFKYKSWSRDASFVAVRNDNYWRTDSAGKQLPYLSSITFNFIPDPTSRSAALETGDVDMIQTSSPTSISSAAEGTLPDGIQADLDTTNVDKTNLVLNNLAGAFTDPDLRIAANEAIDRDALITTLLKPGLYEAAQGPMSNGSSWGNPTMPAYDPEHAKELVAAAGGGTKVPVTLTTVAGSIDNSNLAQFVQQELNDVGFDVKIVTTDLAGFSVGLVQATSDISLTSFWTDTDPDALHPFLVSKGAPDPGTIGLNFARWRNPTVDAAMNAARQSPDDAFRKEQYQIVWNEMAEDAPYAFLYQNIWAILWQPSVYNIGYMTTPDGVAMPAGIWGTAFLTNVWMQ